MRSDEKARSSDSQTRFSARRQRPDFMAASFASTLGSTWLIQQVERDRSLLPYALYRAGLAAVVVRRLRRESASARP